MTREQMSDLAVRRSIKRQTMKRILDRVQFEMEIREKCKPFPLVIQALVDAGRHYDVMLFKKAHPGTDYAGRGWWDGEAGLRGFDSFPRRLQAIRKEFRRIAAEQAA